MANLARDVVLSI